MAFTAGDENATTGLSGAIYTQLDAQLAGGFADAGPDALAAAQQGWRKLAFAIATGLAGYLLANLEINGVAVAGPLSLTTSGSTGSTNSHTHTVTVGVTGNVILAQSNNGTGRVA